MRLGLHRHPLHSPQSPGQKPRRLALLDIGIETPELHRGVLQRLGRALIDLPQQLGDRVQQVVDPLADLGAGQGGGEAGAGPMGESNLPALRVDFDRRASAGPDSRPDAHCATNVGKWEEPSGESRLT